MTTIEVAKASNGWIISHGLMDKREVFIDEETMLLAVYQAVCEWKVGEKVFIKRATQDDTINK